MKRVTRCFLGSLQLNFFSSCFILLIAALGLTIMRSDHYIFQESLNTQWPGAQVQAVPRDSRLYLHVPANNLAKTALVLDIAIVALSSGRHPIEEQRHHSHFLLSGTMTSSFSTTSSSPQHFTANFHAPSHWLISTHHRLCYGLMIGHWRLLYWCL